MSPLLHIFLYVSFGIILYFFCKKLYNVPNSEFWKLASFIIIIFALIEGIRYGRGVDYYSYKYRYEHLGIEEEPQILFKWIMQCLTTLGANYVVAFISYSLLFVWGVFFYIHRSYSKNECCWMYFFALVSMTLSAESMIRQYIAQAFIFFALPYIGDKKHIWIFFIYALCAILIHSGVAIQIPVLLLSFYLIHKTLNWKIWCILLFISYYLLPEGYLVNQSIGLLQKLHLDSVLGFENVSHYIDDSDRWLGEDSVLDAAKQSFLTMSLQFIFEFSVIFSSCNILKKNPNHKVLFLFNIAAIGFILCRLFHGYEIFTRMFQQLYIYWFVPVGFVAINLSRNIINKNRKQSPYIKYAFYLICLYQFFYWGRFVFLFPKAMFFWDKV